MPPSPAAQGRFTATRYTAAACPLRVAGPREREVLSLVIAGPLNKQIAAEMKLSEVTVKVHRSSLMKKFGAKSVADLTKMANVLGVVPRDIER